MAADRFVSSTRLSIARPCRRPINGRHDRLDLASDHPVQVLSLTSIMSSSGDPSLPQAVPDVMAMMMRPHPIPLKI